MSAVGFANAPVSKGVIILTTLASLTASATRASLPGGALGPLSLGALLGKKELWRVVTYQLAFSSAGELVIGVFLLYTLRQFERHWGSRKFGAFVIISKLVGFLIGSSALLWHRSSTQGANLSLASGPYGLIFAGLVQFHFDIPTSAPFSVFGLPMSDKMLFYLFAAQLSASASSASLTSSAAGILTGLLYRFNILGMRSFVVPVPVARAFWACVGPLLDSLGSPSPAPQRRGQGARGDTAARPGVGRAAAPADPRGGFPDSLAGAGWGGGGNEGRRRAAGAPGAGAGGGGRPARDDSEAHATLAGMGFVDTARNQRLLDRYDGNVNSVLDELLS